MTECRLLEENGRRHFMTRRFDRPDGGGKLHMQTVGALEHVELQRAGTYSYEQALLLIRRLGLGTPVVEQQFRRMVFNVVARNQDDHVKNIAFLMDRGALVAGARLRRHLGLASPATSGSTPTRCRSTASATSSPSSTCVPSPPWLASRAGAPRRSSPRSPRLSPGGRDRRGGRGRRADGRSDRAFAPLGAAAALNPYAPFSLSFAV